VVAGALWLFSIRPVEVKHNQSVCSRPSGNARSRVRASLRDQPFGSPSMGSGEWGGTI
jgi:hypothetical protein